MIFQNMKTYLDIPYQRRSMAMRLGARFDSQGWYCPDGVDLMLFKDFLPDELAKWAKLPRKQYKRR